MTSDAGLTRPSRGDRDPGPTPLPPGHGAGLAIDLGAIAANYRLLRDRCAGVEVAATVKADAYGLGLAAVAPALHAAGARKFFVATTAEGAQLRGLLAAAEIFILNGYDPADHTLIASHRLVPALNSLTEIDAWRAAATPQQSAILHLDTGMNRLGLSAADAARLTAEPARLAGLTLAYVISHLACGDEPDHPMNTAQRARFNDLLESVRPCLDPGTLPGTSLAGSSGIFLGSDYHYDLTRPGAALYGLSPTAGRPNPMRPVVYLTAKVLQVRAVDSPMSVGYGAAHKVRGPRKIATISAGYADGYPRRAGPSETDDSHADDRRNTVKGQAWIAGQLVPIVGRVSMDLITLDVTDVPSGAAAPGATVELIGAHISADDVAAQAGTIGYEVLTRLGHRAHRVYWGDPA